MKLLHSLVIVALPCLTSSEHFSPVRNQAGQKFWMERFYESTALTPLHLATCGGQMLDIRMMEGCLRKEPFLLNTRWNVSESDGLEYQYTPLHLATRAGHLRCMIFLLQKDPSRGATVDVNATYGTQGFSALSLTKDSSCINLLLLNGICPDYVAPPHLATAEQPRTLYVNVACQCNNPLALAALLEHDAATLDQDFVDWQLASNNNAEAIFEDAPLCIAISVGAVECVRLLLLHKARVDVVFRADESHAPLLDYCLDRVFNCTSLNNGEQIMSILHQFGAAFDAASPIVLRNKEQSELSSDFSKRALIKKFLRLAEAPLNDSSLRRLSFFNKNQGWREYRQFVKGSALKELETRCANLDRKVLNQKRQELTEFLMFQDLVTAPNQIIFK